MAGNNSITLRALSSRDTFWHTLPVLERIVSLQNTVRALQVEKDNSLNNVIPVLKIGSLSINELHVAYQLARNPELWGPFASIQFEGPNSWRKYVDLSDNEVCAMFREASDGGYWLKYIGLARYSPDRMGEVLHTFNWLCEIFFKDTADDFHVLTPSITTPAYLNALARLDTLEVGRAIVFGAMSLVSVSDIYAIQTNTLPCEMDVLELEGWLSRAACTHYGLNFIGGSALDVPKKIVGKYGAVITNSLIRSASGSGIARVSRDVRIRLVNNIFKTLHSGGVVLMAEPPFLDNKEKVGVDIARFTNELVAAGFVDVEVTYARCFSTSAAADHYVRHGVIDRSKTVLRNKQDNYMFIASGRKP